MLFALEVVVAASLGSLTVSVYMIWRQLFHIRQIMQRVAHYLEKLSDVS